MGLADGDGPVLIALAQSLRIMMVVVMIPFPVVFFDAHGTGAYDQVSMPANALSLMQLAALELLGGVLFAWRLRTRRV